MNEIIKFFTTLENKQIDKKNRIIKGVVGSTGDKDRHGDTVNPEGWDLRNYEKNPTILFGHEYWKFPVGHAVSVAAKAGKLIFDIYITDKTKEGRELFDLICEDTVRAVSVGYRVLKFGMRGEDEYTHMQQELLELSWVPVGSNPNALKSFAEEIKDAAPSIHDKLVNASELMQKVNASVDNRIADAIKDLPTEERVKELIAESQTPADPSQKEVKPEVPTDAGLQVLTSMRDALKASNQASGKGLKEFNQYLTNLKK